MGERAKRSTNPAEPSRRDPTPRRVRLPGFISEEEVGLGDVVKRATAAFGIKPCGGCQRRAAALNRWVVFTGRRPG
ncbi:MAG TPA: hypothetical protein VNZ44_01085 [Pyrinomonadaceae bacterium]|nr:hypothetical protein [Pyrinomonadaceae bacterium]